MYKQIKSILNILQSWVSWFRHKLTGCFSAVLGGSGNCDNNINYVGLYGCNVKGVLACAFHANNFVGQNMPGPYTFPGAFPVPAGGFFYCIDGLGLCHVLIA